MVVLEPLPEKQGLKPYYIPNKDEKENSIRATSRKTRIETYNIPNNKDGK